MTRTISAAALEHQDQQQPQQQQYHGGGGDENNTTDRYRAILLFTDTATNISSANATSSSTSTTTHATSTTVPLSSSLSSFATIYNGGKGSDSNNHDAVAVAVAAATGNGTSALLVEVPKKEHYKYEEEDAPYPQHNSSNSTTVNAVVVVEEEEDDDDNPTTTSSSSSSSSSSNYYFTWVGDHWIPPHGVPTYTPKEMLEYFKGKNTLFIGDSTGRRTYATLYAMMTALNVHNIPKNVIDSARIIDVNKGHRLGEEVCHDSTRSISNFSSSVLFPEKLCRNLSQSKYDDISVPPSNSSSSGSSNSSGSRSVNEEKGKFDYVRMNCYSQVNDYFAQHEKYSSEVNATVLTQEYDLIVFALGIWEVVKASSCEYINDQIVRDPIARLTQTLNTLLEMSTRSSSTRFVFRTVGFDESRGHDLSFQMIQTTREYFQNMTENVPRGGRVGGKILEKQGQGNFILVDWGSAIADRSFKGQRIQGDLKAHYGLQARLLFAQQLMHQLTMDSPDE